MATIRKHRDKYQVQVRRKGFPAISRSFHKLSDAKEWARHMETQADRQELAPNRKELSRISLEELVRRYRDEVVVSKKGVEIETIILDAFSRHPICKKSLAELSAADFAAYRDERLKTITAKSLKRQLSPISNMFELARTEWNIPLKGNPLSDLALKANDNRRERRLRDGELERLLAAGKKTRNPLVLPVIRFAVETGMRRGEILKLCWRDIDDTRETARILEAKNGYSRTIPLTPGALAVLRTLTESGRRAEDRPCRDRRPELPRSPPRSDLTTVRAWSYGARGGIHQRSSRYADAIQVCACQSLFHPSEVQVRTKLKVSFSLRVPIKESMRVTIECKI